MGIADVIPGISGGTVAFVSGIYTRLISALSRWGTADFALLPLVFSSIASKEKRGDLKEALAEKDFGFLLVLGAGIVTAVLTMAKLVPTLLKNYPFEAYSLFFGLIILSVGFPLQKVRKWDFLKFLFFFATSGLALLFFTHHPSLQFPQNNLGVFLAACIAICAMILPGISGAYLLLMMGMYEYVLEALHNREILTVGIFMVGAATGILLFVKLLNRLLEKYQDWTFIALSGLMIGSLVKVWPYQYWVPDSSSLLWGFLLFFAGLNLIAITLWIDRKKEKLKLGQEPKVD